jgi:hypothetical protein
MTEKFDGKKGGRYVQDKIRSTPKKQEIVSDSESKRGSMAKYNIVLGELKRMEENNEYSTEQKPNPPEGSTIISYEINGNVLFTGLAKKDGTNERGVASFCYGRYTELEGEIKYKYLSQIDFEKMFKKYEEALVVQKNI